MDDIDRAQRHEEAARQAALAVRRAEAPAATGACLFCGEPTAERFCDADCRADYGRLQAKRENDRIVGGLA